MHPDMGAVSQAGFVATDAEGRRVKVRGTSWAHGIEETVGKAGEVGLVLEGGEDGGVRERAVDEGLISSGMVGGRGWKWVGTKVWFGFVVRRATTGGGGGEAEAEEAEEAEAV
ncbi:putative methyltransferase AN0656 [Diplodia seriata]|uniref:Putative methyltransferase AN0656 n=1 Tax=Diplodia seriata TaxID=420778 RepID=A0A1S8B6N3_9PEZI|nr:putative methyltransferase AN0656 [Diplodia seriata]